MVDLENHLSLPPFAISYWGLLLSPLFLLSTFLLLRRKGKALKVPSLKKFLTGPEKKNFSFSWLTPLFLHLFLLLLGLSLLDPLYLENISEAPLPLPSQGRAWTLLIDRSSSMGNAVPLPNGEIDSLFRYSLDLFWQEVQHRQGDLFGVITFARVPEIILPLTPDKNRFREVLDPIKPETPGSRNDATAITYSLYKALYLAEGAEKKSQAFHANRNAIILITDGNEKVPEEDLKDPLRGVNLVTVLKKAKEVGVHIYIVSLFPSYNDPRFAPERRRMELIAQSTHGGFFQATPEGLKDLFEEIDTLEGSSTTLALPLRGEGFPLAPILAMMSLVALFFYLLFREVVYLSLP